MLAMDADAFSKSESAGMQHFFNAVVKPAYPNLNQPNRKVMGTMVAWHWNLGIQPAVRSPSFPPSD